MRLNAPSKLFFLISLVLVILAIVSIYVVSIPFVTANAFWVAVVGYIVLAVACVMKGM